MRPAVLSAAAALLLASPAQAGPVADGCPTTSQVVPLDWGDSFGVSGATSGKSDDFSSAIDPTSAGGRDVAVALHLQREGALWVQVDGVGGFHPSLYVRQDCLTDWYAFDFTPSREVAPLHLPVGTYYVVVDSVGAPGRYSLSAFFDAPFCGDGILSPGEECDLGPGWVGDGCTGCAEDPAVPGTDSCPGQAVSIAPGVTTLAGTTIGHADTATGSCRGVPPGGADYVYAVTPMASGTLDATVGLDASGGSPCLSDVTDPLCWDHVLYARTACGLPASEVACSDVDQGNPLGPESISFPVVAGVAYYVFVDGYEDDFYSRGPFDLRLYLH